MKIRSKELYRYLKAQGVLQGSKQDIAKAKRSYRRRYKSDWAKASRKHRHEIRFMLSKDEYQLLKGKCTGKTTPTGLAKDLALAHMYDAERIPNRSELELIARDLGLAINQIYACQYPLAEVLKHLEPAEALLDRYLKGNI